MATFRPSSARPASPRVARRMAETRARIVATAARRFAEAGYDMVGLDEIAAGADVSRGTLYHHFPTKGSIMEAVLLPALDRAADAVRALVRLPADEALDALISLHLDLWREHRDALRFAHHHADLRLPGLVRRHAAFLGGVIRALARAHTCVGLRVEDPYLAATVLARTAVPLLEALERHPAFERLFVASVRGLLVGPSACAAAGGRARARRRQPA